MLNLTLIQNSLELKAPQILNSFGGANSFMQVALENVSSPSEFEEKLQVILSHADELVLLTPSNLSFKLYDNYQALSTSDSIRLELPYSVSNLAGELLYRVSSHNGVFGYSILDRLLLLQSKPTNLYYLQFESYEGTRTLLLVMNLIKLENKVINTAPTLYESPKLLDSSLQNYLYFNVVNAYRNMQESGYPFYSINTYFLPAPPTSSTPNVSATIQHALTQVSSYDLELEPIFILNPQTSGWLVFTQKTNQGEKTLGLTTKTGAGVDRFLEASSGVYYLGLGNEVPLSLLKQNLNQTISSVLPAGTQQVINLKATLQPLN